MLVELAEAGMEISREMMIGVRKATNHDERIAYAAAHDRAGRSVRLSIQLHERLERHEREAARAEAQIQAQGAQPSLAALERKVDQKLDLRKAQVRAAVRRSIEQESEGEDAEILETALDIYLNEQALSWEFMTRPAIETVSHIRKGLKLRENLRLWPGGRAPGPKTNDSAPGPSRAGPS
ncbi:hypothetical protein [Phenylobacterium immobile]|uniref:hypothetical protein n=1 Tax=Phenylobacterium immobile TaxID=21 RepID=UPI000B89047B|nr:hypothetical protein [Phenylobacterium immobile]